MYSPHHWFIAILPLVIFFKDVKSKYNVFLVSILTVILTYVFWNNYLYILPVIHGYLSKL